MEVIDVDATTNNFDEVLTMARSSFRWFKNGKFSVPYVFVVFVQANQKRIRSTDTNGQLTSLSLYR